MESGQNFPRAYRLEYRKDYKKDYLLCCLWWTKSDWQLIWFIKEMRGVPDEITDVLSRNLFMKPIGSYHKMTSIVNSKKEGALRIVFSLSSEFSLSCSLKEDCITRATVQQSCKTIKTLYFICQYQFAQGNEQREPRVTSPWWHLNPRRAQMPFLLLCTGAWKKNKNPTHLVMLH